MLGDVQDARRRARLDLLISTRHALDPLTAVPQLDD